MKPQVFRYRSLLLLCCAVFTASAASREPRTSFAFPSRENEEVYIANFNAMMGKLTEKAKTSGKDIVYPELLSIVPVEMSAQFAKEYAGRNVIVSATVDTTGKLVKFAGLDDFPRALAKDIVTALEQWTFRPAISGGEPQPTPVRVTLVL